MRFYVDSNRALMVEDGNVRELLISIQFLQNANADRAAAYLRSVAARLNTCKDDEIANILERAEMSINYARIAEQSGRESRFCEYTEIYGDLIVVEGYRDGDLVVIRVKPQGATEEVFTVRDSRPVIDVLREKLEEFTGK